ncbi:hypothetical protein E4U43_004930 [Claviceps pusilla]|uniref:Essential protein Yae1 N-terminal domain-containing protein n=1 Tax=Claviceps pusilla TaxID=123648 RepID=A0A9P7SWI2_9HYPO|nr:hypothetical protein E4U43_004930 [Claviceps pusilla]
MSSPDPFDSVLHLEHNFYQQGYAQGLADGAQAGRTEGRQFGMRTGFEKFLESGRLASRAIIWANRMPSGQREAAGAADAAADTATCLLPPLPRNARLDKNVRMLYALVEPETLSTENSDEGVQDFDDRLKRAQGKAKIVERMAS